MCKKLVLIFCLMLLVGCKQVSKDNTYVDLVNNCLGKTNISNEVSLGYKYYVPKGVAKIRDYDYNQVFLVDNCYLYLYVDIISFYHGVELEKPLVSIDDYFELFNYGDKTGYIFLRDDGKQYYLSIVYNYSKIEGYVPKEKLNKVIILSSIILNSIDYNSNIIEKILEGDFGQFSEFVYEVDKPEGASSNFSQYLEEYVQKDDIEDTEQLPGK